MAIDFKDLGPLAVEELKVKHDLPDSDRTIYTELYSNPHHTKNFRVTAAAFLLLVSLQTLRNGLARSSRMVLCLAPVTAATGPHTHSVVMTSAVIVHMVTGAIERVGGRTEDGHTCLPTPPPSSFQMTITVDNSPLFDGGRCWIPQLG